jgi:hypothetical protein
VLRIDTSLRGAGGVQRKRCNFRNSRQPVEKLRPGLQSCLSKADFAPFTYSLSTQHTYNMDHTWCLVGSQRFEPREPHHHKGIGVAGAVLVEDSNREMVGTGCGLCLGDGV